MCLERRPVRDNRLFDGILWTYIQIAPRSIDIHHRGPAAFDMYIPLCHGMLHGVVRLKKHGDLVGGQVRSG